MFLPDKQLEWVIKTEGDILVGHYSETLVCNQSEDFIFVLKDDGK